MLCICLVGVIFGVTQSQSWGWSSPGVVIPLIAAAGSGVLFVIVERRAAAPLLDFRLLAKHRNYAGATLSQGLGGMIEMGLGIILPLLLILNLGMSPAIAGLALLPTTLPMVVVAPLAGRWYDRIGGRFPLMAGFGILMLSGVAMMLAAFGHNFVLLLPGLLLYGTGLAIVLTVNDPVSLDSVPQNDHGQASGVSATAEQFGGALGIALFFLVFHSFYVQRLHSLIDESSLPNLTSEQYAALRDDLQSTEQTGLDPAQFPAEFQSYLPLAFDASAFGYTMAFAGVVVIAALGVISSAVFVRKAPSGLETDMTSAEKVFAAGAAVGSGTKPAG